MTRICATCKEEKPLWQFQRTGPRAHWRDTLCRPCRLFRSKLRRIETDQYFAELNATRGWTRP